MQRIEHSWDTKQASCLCFSFSWAESRKESCIVFFWVHCCVAVVSDVQCCTPSWTTIIVTCVCLSAAIILGTSILLKCRKGEWRPYLSVTCDSPALHTRPLATEIYWIHSTLIISTLRMNWNHYRRLKRCALREVFLGWYVAHIHRDLKTWENFNDCLKNKKKQKNNKNTFLWNRWKRFIKIIKKK